MADKVLFQQPNSPEEFGVFLEPGSLRNLDFSALDYEALNRAGVEYIRTYFPNNFNDFYASNGIMMMLELVSYIGSNLSQRCDILVDEAFLSTAQTKEAVINHLSLINQDIQRQTPATVDVEISLSSPIPSEIKIKPGLRFTIPGADGKSVYYEIFRAPGDFTSNISIPANKRGVIAYGIEGVTGTPVQVTSVGGEQQFVDIPYDNVLDEPIIVELKYGSLIKRWQRVDVIESSNSNDEVYEVRHMDSKTRIIFGDNKAGKSPSAGQVINISFRRGGGIRGRIAASIINETRPINPESPISATIEVLFRNPYPSSGGTDEETLDQAKKRAPREFAVHDSIVTGEDYGLIASKFSHPVFGSVAKAIGIVKTGVKEDLESVAIAVREAATVEDAVNYLKNNFVNRNIVELYVLTEGQGNSLALPNSGLKQGLITVLSEKNVLTDEIVVYDGAIKQVDIKASITLSHNADSGLVKNQVLSEINSFFNIRNFDMGTALYLSSLYNVIQNIPGVKFVNIFSPSDDILPTNRIGTTSVTAVNTDGVGFNEVIVLGEISLQFYFEPGNFKIPPVIK